MNLPEVTGHQDGNHANLPSYIPNCAFQQMTKHGHTHAHSIRDSDFDGYRLPFKKALWEKMPDPPLWGDWRSAARH